MSTLEKELGDWNFLSQELQKEADKEKLMHFYTGKNVVLTKAIETEYEIGKRNRYNQGTTGIVEVVQENLPGRYCFFTRFPDNSQHILFEDEFILQEEE